METSRSGKKENLLMTLDHLGNGCKFIWIILTLTLTPLIFTGMQSMSYIFVTEAAPFWCSVPELTNANWTAEQIKNVSSANECETYNYNYTYFAQVGYDEALKYINVIGDRPDSSYCSQYTYQDIGRSTIVDEWDLVCSRSTDRANTYMALSVGKLIGAAIFGIYSDFYGRKITYIIGVCLFIVTGLATALVPWFWGFFVLKLLTGISCSAIESSSVTTLVEMASNKHRQWMGSIFYIGYPIGTVVLSGLAYLVRDWRNFQLAISVPSLLLLIHIWFRPESPRWLISHGRLSEARKIIAKYYRPLREVSKTHSTVIDDQINRRKSVPELEDSKIVNVKIKGWIHKNFKNLRTLFSSVELTKRLLIMYFMWITSMLCYYTIALDADNFSVDRYIYTLLLGVTEIPSHFVPSAILMVMGRRQAAALLYIIGGVCFLCILGISRENTSAIMGVALTGRFALSAVSGILILLTSELFPTVVRNTAIGTNTLMGCVGVISASYVVEFLGQVSWWLPSTLCGVLALLAGIACLMLPETKGRKLADTIEEETTNERGRVSPRNMCQLR